MKNKLILIIGLFISFISINIFSLNAFYNNFIGKNLYDKKLYINSIKYFNEAGNIYGVYNLANSLYKQRKYKEAIKEYKSIIGTENKDILFAIKHNIGNIFYRLGEKDFKLRIKNREESIKYYSDALNIRYDEETKKNLDFVLNKLKKEKNKSGKDKKQNEKGKDNKENNTKSKKGQSQEKQSKKGDSANNKNQKDSNKQGKEGQNGGKQSKNQEKNKKQLSSSQEQALERYKDALKKEQEKNQSSFNKVYKESNLNDPFSDFFNDPFFNNDLLNNGSLKKDW